jgi:tetratricopeptide (TPR) repeat protein/predicted Ser/Thr protein kinase
MSESARIASVLLANQGARWRQGDPVRVEAYLEQHPGLRTDPEALLELIYHEVVLRQRRGDDPSLAEYLERFGELDGQLRLLFEVDGALEEVAPGGPASTPDFPGSACGAALGRAGHGLGAPPPEALPAVPGYEVLAELGRGGMGVVYLARHVALKRLVALKMILAGPYAGATERSRFRTEAEAAARLDHPNIVRIYEVGEHDGRGYLALEYVEGGRLDERVAGGGQPEREAARLVELLARAVHHAHRHGVLHRDLKPSNILLTGDGVPRITDFGLARLTDAEGPTPTEAVLGTPQYMAPEQAAGKPREVGPAADVYSLGAILYHLLTGRPPFQGGALLDVLDQVRNREPPPPARLRRGLTRDLETVCLKCLEKRPGQRYESALALADDLARFLAGQPVQARRGSLGERLWRSVRRRPALLAKGALALSVLCLGASLVWDLRLAGRLARRGGEKYRAFVRKRDDAFFHGLLTPEQGGLFTGPQVDANWRAAGSSAREALAVAGCANLQAGELKPSLEGRPEGQLAADCYSLLLILAEARGRQLVAGEPSRERYREALRILARARRLGLRTRSYHLRRGRFLGLLGEHEEAAREQRRAAALQPEGALDHFLLGEGCYRRGELAGARDSFARALAVEPEHFWAQFFLAVCDLRRRQWEAARAGLTSCLARRPGFLWAYLFRGLANEKLNAPAQAEADFAKAERLGIGWGEDARYVLLLTRGVLRFEQKDLERAADDFRSARDLKPDQYNAYLNLAQVHRARNEFAQATREVERALRLRPPPPVVFGCLVERGRGLCLAGDHPAALRAFDEALHLFPDHPLPHGWRGRSLLGLRRYPEAERSYGEYLRKGGEPSPDVFRGRGLARMKQGRYPDAVDDYTRALEPKPDAEIYQHRGWAYFFSDAWKLALRDFHKAVELGPGVSDSWTGRGLAWVMLGRYREAVADAESALRRRPRDPAMMHNIACIFAQAVARVEADREEADRQTLSAYYREHACRVLRRALEMLRPEDHLPFWRDKVLADAALAPIRGDPGFVQIHRGLFP